MKIIDCGGQNTPKWFETRAGLVTASRVADLMRKTKTGVSAMRETYMGDIIAEKLAGPQVQGFCSDAMQNGHDQQPNAQAMYAFLRDIEIVNVDFVIHPTIEGAGCSPDGLVADGKGMIEVKCPASKTHISTLLGEPIKPDYVKQMQFQMACCEREYVDFLSYDHRMPAEMQLHIQRVERDDALISEMEAEVRRFLREVDEKVERLRAKYLTQEAAE